MLIFAPVTSQKGRHMMEIGLGRHKKSKNKKIAGSEEKISSTITRHPYPNGLFFQSQLHLSVKTYN